MEPAGFGLDAALEFVKGLEEFPGVLNQVGLGDEFRSKPDYPLHEGAQVHEGPGDGRALSFPALGGLSYGQGDVGSKFT